MYSNCSRSGCAFSKGLSGKISSLDLYLLIPDSKYEMLNNARNYTWRYCSNRRRSKGDGSLDIKQTWGLPWAFPRSGLFHSCCRVTMHFNTLLGLMDNKWFTVSNPVKQKWLFSPKNRPSVDQMYACYSSKLINLYSVTFSSIWDFHTRDFSPLYWAAFFFYKSMIEIVCDNRHSNWTAHNDRRAEKRLNAIYKSGKWQGLQ